LEDKKPHYNDLAWVEIQFKNSPLGGMGVGSGSGERVGNERGVKNREQIDLKFML